MTYDTSLLDAEIKDLILEAVAERNTTLYDTEKDVKKVIRDAVKAIAIGIASGVFSIGSREKKLLDAAVGKIAAGIAEVLSGRMSATITTAAKPVTVPLIEAANSAGLGKLNRSLEVGFQKRELKVFENLWQFERHGRTLSARIWDVSESAVKEIKAILEAGVGQDAVQVARALTAYVKEDAKTWAKNYPNMQARMAGRVPGNVNYEALRLARTELTTAYRDSAVAACINNPMVRAIRWMLSGAHPMQDICDDYAVRDYYGLGPGMYPPGDYPDLAHPNDLCFPAPVSIGRKALEAKLAGYVEDQTSAPDVGALLEG